MKGVTMIQVKYHPVAVCQDEICGWERRPKPTEFVDIGRVIRRDAEQHVKSTGHDVHVIREDITMLGPAPAPERAS